MKSTSVFEKCKRNQEEITASFYTNVKGNLTGINLLNNLKLRGTESIKTVSDRFIMYDFGIHVFVTTDLHFFSTNSVRYIGTVQEISLGVEFVPEIQRKAPFYSFTPPPPKEWAGLDVREPMWIFVIRKDAPPSTLSILAARKCNQPHFLLDRIST